MRKKRENPVVRANENGKMKVTMREKRKIRNFVITKMQLSAIRKLLTSICERLAKSLYLRKSDVKKSQLVSELNGAQKKGEDEEEEIWRKNRNRKREKRAKLKERKLEETKKAEESAKLEKLRMEMLMLEKEKHAFEKAKQLYHNTRNKHYECTKRPISTGKLHRYYYDASFRGAPNLRQVV